MSADPQDQPPAADELSIDSATHQKVKSMAPAKPERYLYAPPEVSMAAQKGAPKSKKGAGGPQARPHFRIDWRQLSYYARPRSYLPRWLRKTGAGDEGPARAKQILDALDGSFRSGELSAILGPSGAGKSTFLSTLFGGGSNRNSNACGQTRVTWFPVAAEAGVGVGAGAGAGSPPAPKRRSLKIAALPQQDHLLHHLTVHETLMFASRIKNTQRFRRSQPTKKATGQAKSELLFHRQNVKRVAKELKLTDCLGTRCGKLSGGQYKRVSIGQELLSEPDVMILDEPTSGLDAMTCLTTIQTLKGIVKRAHPMSVILTIHQPDADVFALFDHVYVIAQGGLAIYEGPPGQVWPTLAQAGLRPPHDAYNPARFLIEQAFVGADSETWTVAAASRSPDSAASAPLAGPGEFLCSDGQTGARGEGKGAAEHHNDHDHTDADDEDDTDQGELDANKLAPPQQDKGLLRRSMQSLTEAVAGVAAAATGAGALSASDAANVELSFGRRQQRRISQRPLLANIGFKTRDGQLISGRELTALASVARSEAQVQQQLQLEQQQLQQQQQIEAQRRLLSRLNALQRARYANLPIESPDLCSEPISGRSSAARDQAPGAQVHLARVGAPLLLGAGGGGGGSSSSGKGASSANSDYASTPTQGSSPTPVKAAAAAANAAAAAAAAAAVVAASTCCSSERDSIAGSSQADRSSAGEFVVDFHDALSATSNASLDSGHHGEPGSGVKCGDGGGSGAGGSSDDDNDAPDDEAHGEDDDNHDGRRTGASHTSWSWSSESRALRRPLRRQFDKRLSARHNSLAGYPHWYHAMTLTHRTWLSIVRDPIFFGIQASMHTTIPILLALIFGSSQEEGCPRVGSFDLVDFAYSDRENVIVSTMRSIRGSMGNIGVMFFEMFVVSFAINCITALVFPLDMHVLLKEYRNGWYSMRSYFIGRTLADLPVPLVLHSIAIAILYAMTGQPASWWRFGSIVLLVIVASLVAQSVGLTIGALLMQSSQSAVLAAAAIVAPFFALSGFIVRIHTLPFLAQLAAKCSYLYHLLNGFIIMRYGFGRCDCTADDFQPNSGHQIPANLHTMASMWIGTFSDEYSDSKAVNEAAGNQMNKTNVDPNIDVVEKLMGAFKMANSYGHQIHNCKDVLPYPMLDFNVRDIDIYGCFIALASMVLVSRLITFMAIYYRVRAVT